jgi:hypothetical protein
MEMSSGEEARGLRAAQNQAFFRGVNERVEALSTVSEVVLPMRYWVCECEDLSCTERMAMTVAEYEEVRAHPSRFAVLDGHVVPEVERVVSAADRFVVVEKIGAGRTYAAEHDPRSNSSA